jgi:hypothetical protein
MTRKRVAPGQVLEIATPGGLAYVQYAARHPEYGDAIRVLPGLFAARPDDFSGLVRDHAYFAFYPVVAAVTQALVEVVAMQPVPAEYHMPRMMRRPGARSRDGRILTWIVIDGDNESVRDKLSPDERQLPIAVIWNHEMLQHRLAERWRPESEG